MNKIWKTAALAALLAMAPAFADTKVGTPVGDVPKVQIAKILAAPESFVGKDVAIEGKVRGVCQVAGCWMELEQDGARMKIKVNDGDLVFPKESLGHTAIARGKVRLIEMSREDYVDYQHHLADELGAKFDEKTVGDGPYRIVQLDGLGAEIAN